MSISALAATFNRPSKEIALDMIYVSTGFQIASDKITLGTPQELDQRPDDPNDPNTFVGVSVDAKHDVRFLSANGFMYRRLSFTDVPNAVSLEVSVDAFPFKTAQVLNQINSQLNLQLTLEDLQDLEYSADQPQYVLKAHPHSLAWSGELVFLAHDGDGKRFLFDVTDLSGFEPYNGV